jgi:hypothetical protein
VTAVGWTANIIALAAFTGLTALLAAALLWRVTQWSVHPAETLTYDEGLAIGSVAHEVAAYSEGQQIHLSFGGRMTLLVFASRGCAPCQQLLEAASTHPATRGMRLVSVSDSDDIELDPDLASRWEHYRFHDEQRQRRNWSAPVSPYFHVIDAHGRIVEKGVANRPGHLDRLLELSPPRVRIHTLGELATSTNGRES